jgi:hypothetical protein
MVACLIFTFGCAGLKPERSVLQNNIFYSSASPKVRMKIHSDFKYIGKAEKHGQAEDADTKGTTFVENESYLFGHIEDNRMLKGVLIKISTIREAHWSWLPDLFPKVKNKLESSVMKIQGKSYQHIVAAFTRVFSKYEEDFIIDKGYIIPNLFLMKGLGRLVGADNKTKIYIFYAEDISRIKDKEYSYGNWRNRYMLTNEQQEFMKGFIDRSEKNIQILAK